MVSYGVHTNILQRYGDEELHLIEHSDVTENGLYTIDQGIDVTRHCDRWQNTLVIRDRGAT